MGIHQRYELASEQYAEYGVDTDAAIEALRGYAISIHCWQADDVAGFERPGAALSGGGIQATGNYPGRARTIAEARQDYERVLTLLPGTHRLNLHASYGEFPAPVERDAIGPEQFAGWLDWARGLGVALDFNCTCFSHPKAESGFTLASKDPAIRQFWIEHVKRCREIAAAFGEAQGSLCIHNLWIPDGAKDITVDRFGHRHHLLESLDACMAINFSLSAMKDAVESKLFGIGAEWFTAGSHEFYLGYALSRGVMLCFDMGHFHPTESVADKVSAYLQFADELLLHVSRPVRWDSDHVVILDDATRDLAFEIVRRRHDKTIHIALDFFDASINRIGAYVTGVRATQQALLQALLSPERLLLELEEAGRNFERLALLETAKALPRGAVWDAFCEQENVPPASAWVQDVQHYERDVLAGRG
ncbi:MAG: L-rhamnose isomerase [Candidatus Hydrogenedens sp.]|nr:L-rhamnose isomerase [Candidatus Hydrogenedens sp.]